MVHLPIITTQPRHKKCHLKLVSIMSTSAPHISWLERRVGTPHSNSSFYKGMTEFQEGEVSVICRKIILIHGQGPGFCYLQVKRFKWGFSQVLMNTTIFEFEFPSTGICFWFWTWFSCRPMTMELGLSQPITASLHHCGRGGAVGYTQINQHNRWREI